MSEEELMLMEVLKCRRIDLYLEKKGLSKEQLQQFESLQERRARGEPIQYILGHTDFMGFKLFVDKRVLVPRPETEIMTEAAISHLHKMYSGRTLRVLEVGTGSGCISIALAKNFPDCEITALDISAEALEVARRNAHFQQVFEKIRFLNKRGGEYLQTYMMDEEKFDLVVSNPPYIPTAKLKTLPKNVQQEPKIALDGGEDGLDFVRQLMALSSNVLKHNGQLIFEIWDGQSATVHNIYEYSRNFKHIEFGKDYTDTNRYVVCYVKAPEQFTYEKLTQSNSLN